MRRWWQSRREGLRGRRYRFSSVKSEKFFRGFGGGLADFFQPNAACSRDRFRHDARVCGLAAFSAERNGRQIRAICFHHKLPKGNLGRNISYGYAVLESHNPGEGNEMVEIDNFVRLFERTAKTMEYAAQLSRIRPHDLERVVPSVALMN